jgi:hypothetical protein
MLQIIPGGCVQTFCALHDGFQSACAAYARVWIREPRFRSLANLFSEKKRWQRDERTRHDAAALAHWVVIKLRSHSFSLSDTNLLTPCAFLNLLVVLLGFIQNVWCVMLVWRTFRRWHWCSWKRSPSARHLLLMVMTHRHTIPLVYYLTPIWLGSLHSFVCDAQTHFEVRCRLTHPSTCSPY